jgi:prolyl-tRNA editing enzyme YbaK/EbsC (Cys-tRNA(Pro) deacylase)
VRKALALAQRPRIATASESETLLGQQIGGNSPLNADNARVLIDPEVLAMDWILTGGGDARSLVRISIAELRRVVGFTEARVRK